MLNIPATSKETAIAAMKAISDAHETKKDYDLSATIKAERSAKALIEGYTPPSARGGRSIAVLVAKHHAPKDGRVVAILSRPRTRGRRPRYARLCATAAIANYTAPTPTSPPRSSSPTGSPPAPPGP